MMARIREQKLERIGLSVAAHNQVAAGLYENLGYKVETLRMFKILSPSVIKQGR
jgi:ribosomal protein S18 acetylase RimI-like enzyme